MATTISNAVTSFLVDNSGVRAAVGRSRSVRSASCVAESDRLSGSEMLGNADVSDRLSESDMLGNADVSKGASGSCNILCNALTTSTVELGRSLRSFANNLSISSESAAGQSGARSRTFGGGCSTCLRISSQKSSGVFPSCFSNGVWPTMYSNRLHPRAYRSVRPSILDSPRAAREPYTCRYRR